MLGKEALQLINDWFGYYVYDNSVAKGFMNIIAKHNSGEDAVDFFSPFENEADTIIHRLAKISGENCTREDMQNLLNNCSRNALYCVYIRYSAVSEYLNDNPDKEIHIGRCFVAAFPIADRFRRYAECICDFSL